MNTCKKAGREPEQWGFPTGELAQLLAGLERQKEELGPIADELIGLLKSVPEHYPEEAG